MRSSVKLVSRTLSLVLIAVIRGYQLAISPAARAKMQVLPVVFKLCDRFT